MDRLEPNHYYQKQGNDYYSITEHMTAYGFDVWEIIRRNREMLCAFVMDFWRKSVAIWRLDYIRNEKLGRKMIGGTIVDTTETKQLVWYGYLQRMPPRWWPKKIWDCVASERKKRRRPRHNWKGNVAEAMKAKGLQRNSFLFTERIIYSYSTFMTWFFTYSKIYNATSS